MTKLVGGFEVGERVQYNGRVGTVCGPGKYVPGMFVNVRWDDGDEWGALAIPSFVGERVLERIPTPGIADAACAFLDEVAALVRTKNAAYGNSAADPVRIFSRAASDEQLLVRIDDKLSRVARGGLEGAGEDVLVDLVGYLALLAAKRRGAK